MRHYELFKAQAQRLTSITCDGCDRELYVGIAHGADRQIKFHAPGDYRAFDLCEECFGHAKEALGELLSP